MYDTNRTSVAHAIIIQILTKRELQDQNERKLILSLS
jgi:hypothetical protein